MEFASIIVLSTFGLLFLCLGAGILRKQSQAKHCDRHRHRIGQIATLFAYFVFAAGFASIVVAILFWQLAVASNS